MTRVRSIPLEKYKGAMSLEEHAIAVPELLNAQSNLFKNSSNRTEVCPIVQGSLLLKLRTIIRESQLLQKDPDHTPISSGALVSTRNAKICPKGDVVVSRHNRRELYGNVIRESPYFPGFWLVHFKSEHKYYYVYCQSLKLISPASSPCKDQKQVTNNQDEMVDHLNCNQQDQDMVLFCVLSNKIHQCRDHSKYSIPEIVEKFAPYFPWFTKNKLQKFINKHRQELYPSISSSTCNDNTSNSPDSVLNTNIFNDPRDELAEECTTANMNVRDNPLQNQG